MEQISAPTGNDVHVAASQHHTLKTWPEYMDSIENGQKTFEVRKNDRGFRLGDILHLREWCPKHKKWGTRIVTCSISYILHGPAFGICEGYCVMGIKILK